MGSESISQENKQADLEQRLAALENARPPKREHRMLWLLGSVFLVVIVILLGGAYISLKHSHSFSHRLQSFNTDFTLYAPEKSSIGAYDIDKSSLQNTSGFVTYTFRSGKLSLTVTQQKAPSRSPDLSSFSGFDKLNLADVGEGVVGRAYDHVIAVVVADGTIINITGSSGTTKQTVSLLATSLKPVH